MLNVYHYTLIYIIPCTIYSTYTNIYYTLIYFYIGDGFTLLKRASEITPYIILIIPKNVTNKQLRKLHKHINMSTSKDIPCVVEYIYLYDKHKMTVVYYGDIFVNKGS